MRFLPLLSSRQDPGPWISFRNVELAWEGGLHPGWEAAVRAGVGVHAFHMGAQPWGEALVGEALDALHTGLGVDFLVVPAGAPGTLSERTQFLGALEALLEALLGRGVKIALRPAAGATSGLVSLLKELRCDAVGYCWDGGVGADLEIISDRLFCALAEEGGDYLGLQRLGYRWNMALPSSDPAVAAQIVARLQAAHPMVFFPEVTA